MALQTSQVLEKDEVAPPKMFQLLEVQGDRFEPWKVRLLVGSDGI